MLIFWGVTPLVSSVFARSVVTVEHLATARTRAALIPLKDQSLATNTGFMMTAYGIVWLGQAMPEFVTSQGYIEPFGLDMEQGAELLNVTWKARTNLYGTSLNCKAADIKNDPSYSNAENCINTTDSEYSALDTFFTGSSLSCKATDTKNDKPSFSYSNGKGCTTDSGYSALDSQVDSQIGGLYIGYYLDQLADFSLEGMGCPSPTNKHLFLALWEEAVGDNGTSNVAAAFCEPTYWTQQVDATVRVPSMNVTEISPRGPRIPLSDNIFNRTALEYGIGTGAQGVSPRADISKTTNIIDQSSRLREFGIFGTVTNMVGFALGLDPTSITGLSNTTILAAKFEGAHKLLHALAMRQLMSSDVIEPQSRQGTINGKISTITIVRPLAIVVEILSGLVVTLILALMTYTYKRPSQLCNNPASLTNIITMAPVDDGTPRNTDEITSGSEGPRFRLLGGRICVSPLGVASRVPDSGCPSVGGGSSLTKTEAEDRSSLARPVEMSMTVA
ncbi:MAG: hypothetical protein Q9198_006101, partial [Flavoplaca austrocitrina]